MKGRKLWSSLLLILLLALVSACGGGKSAPTATPAPTSQPEATQVTPTPGTVAGAVEPTSAVVRPTVKPTPVQPTPTPKPSPTAERVSGVTLGLPGNAANVQDFRAHFVLRVTGEGLDQITNVPPDTPVVEWTIEQTRKPPAKRIVMRGLTVQESMPQAAQQGGALEIIQVGDKMWFKVGNSFTMVTSNANPPNPEADLYDLGTAFSTLDWEKQGREKVNGFDTTHYHVEVDLRTPESGGPGILFEWLREANIKDANVTPQKLTADVYATRDGLVVKAIYRATYTAKLEGKEIPITEEILYEVEGINMGLEIKPPQEGMPKSEVPLPEGARHLMSVADTEMYEIPNMSMADVLTFYEKTLPQEGFTIAQKTTSPQQGGMLQVLKDGKRYIILLQVEGSKVMVQIHKTP